MPQERQQSSQPSSPGAAAIQPKGWVSLRTAFLYVLAHVEVRLGIPPDQRNGSLRWWDTSPDIGLVPTHNSLKELLLSYKDGSLLFPYGAPDNILVNNDSLYPDEVAIIQTHCNILTYLTSEFIKAEASGILSISQ